MDRRLGVFVAAWLVIAFVVLSGCTDNTVPHPALAPPPAGCRETSPEQFPLPPLTGANDISRAIPEFDAYAGRTFRESGVPGMAVAIVKNDTVVYLRSFGVRNVATQEPVTPGTRFQLASISKSFTSASIASMVGRGELAWDDKVSAVNPAFRLYDPWVTEHVTFRDLLSHRTGLPEYAADELQETFAYNRSEIQSRLRFIHPTGEFRGTYAYMNADITAAAEAAALKAGIPWEDLLRERVLLPAGMMNTSARFSDFEGAEDHAGTYPMLNRTPVAGPLLNDDPNSPAGGVSSTIADMARYARLQLNDGSIDGTQVIDAAALKETHRPQIIMKSSPAGMTAYCLGWEEVAEDGRVRIEHGGDLSSGVSTYITLYPQERMAIVVLTNGFPGGAALKRAVTKGWEDLYFRGSVQKDWFTGIERALFEAMQKPSAVLNPWKTLPPAPAAPNASRPASAYAGAYTQEYYGTVRIAANGTGLLMYPGYATEPLVLGHYDGDTFRETTTNTGVYFMEGAGGAIGSARFAMFDLPGRDGTFRRT